jgi:G3E family GTPase
LRLDLDAVLGRDAFNLERILEIEPEFLNQMADHEHDEEISSLSLISERPMNPERFIPWIEEVTRNFGMGILRMKGIIAMQGDAKRFVIQGVHMLIEGSPRQPWKTDEQRASRLVFIGRDLPKDALRRGFEECGA